MARYIKDNHEKDGIDRRGFLNCMAWAGTGVLYAVTGGIARGQILGHPNHRSTDEDTFSFVQISDSHIGFSKEANKDVIATLREAVAKINALPAPPAFMIHTGDISHLSKPEEFDTVDKILQTAKVGRVWYVPGEHDVLTDNGKQYLERYGKGTRGSGWFSFDQKGVHFIGLVNVLNLKAGGLGSLGDGATGMAGRRPEGTLRQHADRGVCPRASLDPLPGVGLGHGRRHAGSGIPETVRLGDGVERPYPSDHPEGRRQYNLPHRGLHRLPAAETRHGAIAGAHERAF